MNADWARRVVPRFFRSASFGQTQVIAYRVSRTNETGAKKEKLVSFDSTVWARKDGGWEAVMHTETPAPA